jgi:hypothetical protein
VTSSQLPSRSSTGSTIQLPLTAGTAGSARYAHVVEPERVLVCTDGSQYNHPDEDALELVRKHYPGVPIIFSDDTPVTQERAAQLGATGPSSFSPTIKLPPAQ